MASRFHTRANNFDLIRLLAAILVLASHSFVLTGNPEPLAKFGTSGGDIAVSVFFIVSGFLVLRSLERRELSEYLLARTRRIVPALTVVVVLTTLVVGVASTTLPTAEYLLDPRTWDYLRTSLVFDIRFTLPGVFEDNAYPASVNGSLWTLPLEAVWYLLLPVLAMVGLTRRVPFAVFASGLVLSYIAAILLGGASFEHGGSSVLRSVSAFQFLRYGTFFIIGAAFWVFRDRVPMHGGLAVVFAVLCYATIGTAAFGIVLPAALAYLTMYLAVIGSWGHALSARVGDLSYGTYLYAFPIQQLLAHFVPGVSPWVMMALALPCTLVCAWLSWHLVERRLIMRPATSRSV